MIKQATFAVEPWCLTETRFDPELIAQTESLFALSNGHLGWRGNLDEGEPHILPGSYLNGVYESHPQPYAETSYGMPESGQTLVNVINGKLIRLLVDDEPFDLRYGELRSHERVLDLRAGVLHRRAEWVSPAGAVVRVFSTRMVSFTQRAVAAISYEVEPVGEPVHIAVQSVLLANEELPPLGSDPRVAAVLEQPLTREDAEADGPTVVMVYRTNRSGLRVGTAVDHLIEGSDAIAVESRVSGDGGMVTAAAALTPGERLRVIKFVAYGWSSERSLPAVRDQVWAALSAARQTGWDGLLADQRAYLDTFWKRADVEVDGDTEIQQAVRFGLFHVLQAGARGENRPLPAKGLTGVGYDGHAFWDTETFVLPVLTMIAPDAAASALRWRHSALPLAMKRARELGYAGAAFPWRTITGEETSGYWPASTAAVHVSADVADAVVRYVDVTGDTEFERGPGLDLLVQTARFWRSLGHHDPFGKFHIDGVTGPDEYSAIADDNVYTNLMARQNLEAAADVVRRYPHRALEVGITMEEAASWRDAAIGMHIPFDDVLGVHSQAERFTSHQPWDFENTRPDQYPLLLHFPYFDLYRKQVVKQADLVLAMYLRGAEFAAEQKTRNFDFYEPLTVRDSSLSASTQAVVAAEVGHLGLAYDYLGEAALIDLHDVQNDTRDGLHIASLAGAWIVLVGGFGGMRTHRAPTSFAPQLAEGLTRIAFNVTLRGRWLRVEVSHGKARYVMAEGEPLEIVHHGEQLTVSTGEPQERPIPAAQARARPRQPRGREPARREQKIQ